MFCLQALSEKYEALREFLILESLIQNTGESEWATLSEQQRQTQLRELKAKHQQLRREGNNSNVDVVKPLFKLFNIEGCNID